jgi:hypothetical protein
MSDWLSANGSPDKTFSVSKSNFTTQSSAMLTTLEQSTGAALQLDKCPANVRLLRSLQLCKRVKSSSGVYMQFEDLELWCGRCTITTLPTSYFWKIGIYKFYLRAGHYLYNNFHNGPLNCTLQQTFSMLYLQSQSLNTKGYFENLKGLLQRSVRRLVTKACDEGLWRKSVGTWVGLYETALLQ